MFLCLRRRAKERRFGARTISQREHRFAKFLLAPLEMQCSDSSHRLRELGLFGLDCVK